MRSFIYSALAAVTFAADATTDYSQNGKNWGELCQTGREQSPIDFGMVTMNENLGLELSGF